jgi:hypothetical protein
MEASLAVSIASTVIALCALVVSILVSIQQVRQMRRQNLSPVVLGAFKEARTLKWLQARDWILNHLKEEHPADWGVSGLGPAAKGKVRYVGYFYDHLGVLVRQGIVNEDLVIKPFGHGLCEVWNRLEPYISREREREPDYMESFQYLACLYESRHPAHPAKKTLQPRKPAISQSANKAASPS